MAEIYLLLVILMMQIFLVRVHRTKLKEIVSDGDLVAQLTIRGITVRGIDHATTAIDPVVDPISTTG